MERFGAFSTGVAVSSAVLGYYIYLDIEKSAESVNRTISALRADTMEANDELRKRIIKLEAKILK